jgi:hypothetical protein
MRVFSDRRLALPGRIQVTVVAPAVPPVVGLKRAEELSSTTWRHCW